MLKTAIATNRRR